ncbi:MAG: DUF7305 domain-containing protein [Opitutaceae bacterium]
MKTSISRKSRLGISILALSFMVTLSMTPSNLDAAKNGKKNGATNTDDTGSGDTGSGDTGSGDTGSGDTGSDDTGSGDTGSGDAGSGDTGSGDTGSGDTGSGDTGSGYTGSGDTGSGDASADDTASTSKGNGNANGSNNTGETAGDSSGSSSGVQLGKVNGSMISYYEAMDYDLPHDIDIVGPVTMIFDGDFRIGNKSVNITSTGSLIIYASGNISVSGNGGINNTDVPSKLIIIGTHPELADNEAARHSITLSGNGFLSGAVYAPDAKYLTNGGGNGGATLGSVVAKEVRFNGSPGPFHYDEALGDLDLGVNTYSLSSYKLLKSANERLSSSFKSFLGDSTNTYKAAFDAVFSSQK